jgi:hypothetical protein
MPSGRQCLHAVGCFCWADHWKGLAPDYQELTVQRPGPFFILTRIVSSRMLSRSQARGPADGQIAKTAEELEVMILSRMETISECPVGMTVIVKRRGNTWEPLTISPDQEIYLDCVARVTHRGAQNRIRSDGLKLRIGRLGQSAWN